jgi:hypothetical protein
MTPIHSSILIRYLVDRQGTRQCRHSCILQRTLTWLNRLESQLEWLQAILLLGQFRWPSDVAFGRNNHDPTSERHHPSRLQLSAPQYAEVYRRSALQTIMAWHDKQLCDEIWLMISRVGIHNEHYVPINTLPSPNAVRASEVARSNDSYESPINNAFDAT